MAPWSTHRSALLVAVAALVMGPAVAAGEDLASGVRSSLDLVMVLWGEGRYAPWVTGEEHPSVGDLLGAVAGGPCVSGVAADDTTCGAVGRFAGTALVSPAPGDDAVDDAAITAELARGLEAGTLPPPRDGATGHPGTLYLVVLPAGKRITVRGDDRCAACAYHGTLRWNGRAVPYAVLPDTSPGSGCDGACGTGTPFEVAAGVVTREIVAATARAAGPPAAPVVASAGPALAPAVARADPASPAPGAAAAAPAAGLAPRPVVAESSPAAPVPPLALLPRAVPAEPGAQQRSRGVRVEIVEDNDSLSAQRPTTDELYTNGLRVSARWAIEPDGDSAREVGVLLGQNIYTPHDLRTRDLSILRQDRPFAGWLYLAFLFSTSEPAPHTLRLGADASGPGELATDIAIIGGVTGPPSLGSEVQTTFHAWLRRRSGSQTSSPNPAGWGVYQTATAPTLDATFRRQVDLLQASAALGAFTTRTGSVLGLRLSPRVRVDLGTTFDAIGAGVETRLGLLARRRAIRARRPFELYAFARADGRLVGRNALIEGPLRNGVTTLVGVRRQVGELDVGAVLRLGHLELGYATLWRTSELTPNPPLDRSVHAVGRVTVAYIGG